MKRIKVVYAEPKLHLELTVEEARDLKDLVGESKYTVPRDAFYRMLEDFVNFPEQDTESEF